MRVQYPTRLPLHLQCMMNGKILVGMFGVTWSVYTIPMLVDGVTGAHASGQGTFQQMREQRWYDTDLESIVGMAPVQDAQMTGVIGVLLFLGYME